MNFCVLCFCLGFNPLHTLFQALFFLIPCFSFFSFLVYLHNIISFNALAYNRDYLRSIESLNSNQLKSQISDQVLQQHF